MASRKTYFGIGWPQDAPDPDSGAVSKVDVEDQSSPTVVDDEKVAEGLRQLRSWYQDDAAKDPAPDPAAPQPAPATASGKVGARPTAVGHATAPPAQAAARPFAPDPMRATMYGHDVHKFDLEAPPPADSEPTRVAPSTALVVADQTRPPEAYPPPQAYPPPGEAVPQPASGRPTSDPFQLARFGHGEAERLPRSARRSGAFQPTGRPTARVPWASRIMFLVGLAALAIALVTWFQSGGAPEAPIAPPPAATRQQPAVPTPPLTPPTPAAAPGPGTATTTAPIAAPERAVIPAVPTPIPAASAAPSKTEQLRMSPPPASARTRRHREPKPVVVEPTEVDQEAAPAQEKATREPNEAKGRSIDKDTAEVKAAKEAKDPGDAKETKETKDPAKDLKETKALRESRGTKARAGDVDNTLPPSLD